MQSCLFTTYVIALVVMASCMQIHSSAKIDALLAVDGVQQSVKLARRGLNLSVTRARV